jgi:hypothetical protein
MLSDLLPRTDLLPLDFRRSVHVKQLIHCRWQSWARQFDWPSSQLQSSDSHLRAPPERAALNTATDLGWRAASRSPCGAFVEQILLWVDFSRAGTPAP